MIGLPIPSHDIPQIILEIQSGHGLSLSAAGKLFPGHRGGEAVDPSTVFRWRTTGSRAANGSIVKLESVRVGGRWLTSRGAVSRFVAALTSASTPDATSTPPPPRTPNQRRKASERAEAALINRGS